MLCFPLFLTLFLQQCVIPCVSMVVPVLSQMFACVHMDSLVPTVRMVIFSFFSSPHSLIAIMRKSVRKKLWHKINNQVMYLRSGAKQKLHGWLIQQLSKENEDSKLVLYSTQHLCSFQPVSLYVMCSLVACVHIQLPTLTPFYLILSLLLMFAPKHSNTIFTRQAW